jgi:hypothetical protein
VNPIVRFLLGVLLASKHLFFPLLVFRPLWEKDLALKKAQKELSRDRSECNREFLRLQFSTRGVCPRASE